MILKYKAADCPSANGRTPKHGESQWTVSIPLEGEDYLELQIGQKGFDALKLFVTEQERISVTLEILP